MFISVLDLFKVGIGPSSSHTMGPMVAAKCFRDQLAGYLQRQPDECRIQCTLKGSLAHTGHGHGTDKAIILGFNGYIPHELRTENTDALVARLSQRSQVYLDNEAGSVCFDAQQDIVFDLGEALPQHPNGMIFKLYHPDGSVLYSATYFSIGGGFIASQSEIDSIEAPIKFVAVNPYPYPFDSATSMLQMADSSGLSIAKMKQENEISQSIDDPDVALQTFLHQLDEVWEAMQVCIRSGLTSQGLLPGGLEVKRRASTLYHQLQQVDGAGNMNDWLCAYAMAVNEENAAGRMVVTAPTNGAAGVIPAVLYYFLQHEGGKPELAREYLLTAAAIGGLIKHRSSISGAEVGCQGEVGSAAAMAAAGLCAVKGGTAKQIENAAEIALEHHLGMTCDPVKGLVQVPCIERNGFGAIKAYTAASLALRGSGEHFMSLDNCIEAMRQTGEEMSHKFKETALGGLAQSWTEC